MHYWRAQFEIHKSTYHFSKMNRVIFETSKWMIFLYTYEFPKISGNPNLNNLALLHCISKTWCKSPLMYLFVYNYKKLSMWICVFCWTSILSRMFRHSSWIKKFHVISYRLLKWIIECSIFVVKHCKYCLQNCLLMPMHAALLPKIQKLLHDWLLYVCCTCCRHTLAQCWCLWIPIRITTFTMTSMYRSTEMSTSTSSHLICKYHHIFCITCNKRKGSVLFTFGNSKFVFLNWCLWL